jgi:DNA-binding transcriptional LysR family regulator
VVAVRWRVGLLAFGAMALFAGVLAGLARLGVAVPDAAAGMAALHGPLMIGGFFGTVIALERAVALGRRWPYAAPLLAGLATLAAFAGVAAAPWLLVAASVVLGAATADVFRRQPALFTLTLLAGAASWLAGNLAFALGGPPHASTWPWLAFLVLTIAGERLELTRLLPPSPVARRMFGAILAAIALALAGSAHPLGTPLLGAALLGLAAWLGKQDIARRTVRGQGLTRYVAVCLLSGYAWLAVASPTATYHESVPRMLDDLGIAGRTVVHTRHYAALPELVTSTDLLAIVPQMYARTMAERWPVRVWQLPGEALEYDVRMVWHATATREPAHAWLRAIVVRLFGRAAPRSPS